jgi:hypothetical protein
MIPLVDEVGGLRNGCVGWPMAIGLNGYQKHSCVD